MAFTALRQLGKNGQQILQQNLGRENGTVFVGMGKDNWLSKNSVDIVR